MYLLKYLLLFKYDRLDWVMYEFLFWFIFISRYLGSYDSKFPLLPFDIPWLGTMQL